MKSMYFIEEKREVKVVEGQIMLVGKAEAKL